jgi:hypothetical protein
MVKVGGEVDTLCSRCELVLAHTVIAMVGPAPVKVQCNTCRTVHRHRAPAAAGRPSPRTSGARTSPRAPSPSFDEQLASRKAPPRRYAPAESFGPGDVVDHPTFGRGFVSADKGPDKIEVTFRTGVRTLVQGKRPA